MNGLLASLSLVFFICVAVFVPDVGASAVLLCVIVAAAFGSVISRSKIDRTFLLQVFVSGLLVRAGIGAVIYLAGLQEFFGGDAFTYDAQGFLLWRSWQGDDLYEVAVEGGSVIWGMPYLVAAIYTVVGRNMLAVQFFNAVIGAATAPVIFLCAQHIYGNLRVARLSALFVGLFPSLVLWSSQGLKDGPVVFLLAMAMLMTLKLGERLSVKYLLAMLCTLLGLLSLRFYIFYLVAAAVGGAFLVGMKQVSAQSLARQLAIILAIGLSLTYVGVLRRASAQFESYGSLEAVQRTRSDLAQSASSGFGQDVDVSTTGGALSAIPVGMIYLLFAPFPWQLASLRQSITLPEMLIWWGCFPLLILGLYFTLRYRARQALPILLFTAMLTLAYSIFQGNVGTAYRQRSQVLVFYFIFVAVGTILLKERGEDRTRQTEERRVARRQQRDSPRLPAQGIEHF